MDVTQDILHVSSLHQFVKQPSLAVRGLQGRCSSVKRGGRILGATCCCCCCCCIGCWYQNGINDVPYCLARLDVGFCD
jgi:hypothetical protein